MSVLLLLVLLSVKLYQIPLSCSKGGTLGTLGFKMRIGPPYPHARRKRQL